MLCIKYNYYSEILCFPHLSLRPLFLAMILRDATLNYYPQLVGRKSGIWIQIIATLLTRYRAFYHEICICPMLSSIFIFLISLFPNIIVSFWWCWTYAASSKLSLYFPEAPFPHFFIDIVIPYASGFLPYHSHFCLFP